MAQDTSITAVRASILTSLFGRRIGLDKNNFLVGPHVTRLGIEGYSSAGSSTPSTGLATLTYDVTVGGSVASSGTTAASPACQQLPAPIPGVRKTLFNMTTGMFTVGTTAQSAYFMSTGSAGSTYQYATLWAKGVSLELIGLTTSLWGVLGNNMTTVSTNVSFI